MQNRSLVQGLEIVNSSKSDLCEPCLLGKHHRTPFPVGESTRASGLLDLIHSDLCGPMNMASFSGARYFITFIDDHSRRMFVYFLHSKDQALNAFNEFKALVENETGRNIKRVRTDGGGEYCSNALKSVFKSAGIEHQITPPHTPQQNVLDVTTLTHSHLTGFISIVVCDNL